MFGSDILDIVIGMVFIFLVLSLVCSAMNELLEALVKNRARDLERGIRELIGDPDNATNFVEKIYNHGLVNSLFKGCYSADKKRNLPSYIPSANFALAVIDLVENPPAAGMKLPPNVQKAYEIFARRAAGDATKLQASLEDWFDSGMDRVSGWYKRRSQWILVAFGLVISVALNADAVVVARALSNDASLRKGLVALAQARASQPLTAGSGAGPGAPSAGGAAAGAGPAAETAAAAQAGTVEADGAEIRRDVATLGNIGLPIGWGRAGGGGAPLSSLSLGELAVRGYHGAPRLLKLHLFGWLLTAIAISMGAPFWFDMLGKIISVRSTLKPQATDS